MMFVAKVGGSDNPNNGDDPEPSPRQPENGGKVERDKRIAKQFERAHEILVQELGQNWQEKIPKLAKIDKLQLAKKLLNAGVSAGVITGVLRLRGADLGLIKLGLAGDDGKRSEKAADESVKPKEMEDNEDRPEEVDVDRGRSGKVADANVEPKKVEVDEERKLTKEEVIEQVLAEADMRGAEKAAEVDRDYQMKLRAKAMQSTKPVEAREIMDMTFHHNLEQALGRYVAHLLSSHGLVKLDKQMVLDNDWRKAFITYAEVMDRLIQLHEDAKLLDRIKRERDLYEAYLSYIIEVFEKKTGPTLMRYYQAYTMLTERLPQVLCSSCKRKLTDMLVAESIVGVGA